MKIINYGPKGCKCESVLGEYLYYDTLVVPPTL